MFEERNRGQSIVFSVNDALEERTEASVANGDSVSLRKDGEDVLVRDVKAIGPARFTGIIYGFEPSYGLEYHGLNLGDEIEFEERHIFACSAE